MKARWGKAQIGVAIIAGSLLTTPTVYAQTPEPTATPTATSPATADPTTTADPTPTATASPSPSPSQAPEPTPFPTPTTPAPEPTPTATLSPTPSQPPSSTPEPAPTPSGPSTLPNSPFQPGTPDAPSEIPSRNKASDELSEVGPEVLAAQAALEAAQARLSEAEAHLAEIHAAVDRARELDERARLDVEETRLTEQKVQQELTAVRQRIQSIRDTAGEVAREAYRGGAYLQLSVALEAATPKEFTDRLVSVQTVLQAQGSVVGELAESRSDLVNQQAKLEALRVQQEQVRLQSAKLLSDKLAVEEAAVAAQAELAAAVAQRETALKQLEAARVVDQQRYEAFSAVAGGLGNSIRQWAAELRRAGQTVNGTGRFMWPGTGIITSRFGPRFHPILHYTRMHTGLDVARGDGYVYASDNGVVVFTGWRGGYGNLTIVDHGRIDGRPIATGYGHQATMFVKPGQVVRKGQRIGVIGSTGLSTGPHIHFEVRVDGVPVDPFPWVAGAARP